MRRVALTALLVLAACGRNGERDADANRPPESFPNPTDTEVPARFPSPLTETCAATCARLEPVGPVSELAPPFEESGVQVALTYGDDHWYAAWGGRPSIVTQVQRFTKEGLPAGATKRIEGTTPEQLELVDHQLLLWGWIPPAYAPTGIQSSLHRFDAALDPLAGPLRFRSTSRVFGPSAISGNALVTTALARRMVPLARELTIDLAQGEGQTLGARDWHVPEAGPTASDFSVYERIGDQRFVVFYKQRAIRIAALEDDGSVPTAINVLEANFEEDNVVVISKRIGGTWWVGGYAARSGPTTLHLRRVDPIKRAGVGDEIPISWPEGFPGRLVDANGTPMLLGMIGETPRWVLVPIDVDARAICRPMTFGVSTQSGHTARINAVHFAGAAGAGLMLEGWSGKREMFFTRATCQPR